MTSDCLLAAYKICLDFNFPSKLLFPFIRENWGILTDFYPTVSDSIVQERHFFSCCKNLTVGPLDKCSSRASEQRPDSSILVSKPTESGQDQTCISLLPSTTISSLPTEFFFNQNCEKYIDALLLQNGSCSQAAKETDGATGRQTENKLVYGWANKKISLHISLALFWFKMVSCALYFDDRPMPLMVI